MSEIAEKQTAVEAAFAQPSERDSGMAPTMPLGTQIETVPLGAQKVAVRRDEGSILQKIRAFASAAGDDWYYSWSTKNRDGSRGTVEGASIDAALYVVRLYGNCDVDVRVQDFGDSWLYYARFTDFETGFRLMRAYQQRKSQNTGMRDADRQADIVFQIGQSKAIRNVICNALRPFTDFAFTEAKGALVKKVGERLDYYRERVNVRLKELGVAADRVERIVGRPLDKWLAPDIAKVIAQLQAVSEGMAHTEDLWPAPETVAPPRPAEDEPAKDNAKPEQKHAEREPVVEEKPEPSAKHEEAESRPDDALSAAYAAAVESLAKFEESAKTDAAMDVTEFRKRGRGLIDEWEGLSDDEREMLRGRFTTFCLELQRARGKKRGR